MIRKISKYYLTSILCCLIFSSLSGQELNYKADSLLFPPKSFNCNNLRDSSSNSIWSQLLISANKKSLYKDSTIEEAYRLVYWGKYISIIEIKPTNGKYTLSVDKLTWDGEYTYWQIDSINLIPIRVKCDSLWDVPSTLDCYKEGDPIVFDDRDSWLLEYKINGKYKSIVRRIVKQDLKELLVLLMHEAKLKNFGIFNNANIKEEY